MRKLPIPLALLVVPLLVSGCITVRSKKSEPPPDGFVYRSTDSGATWKQSALLLRAGATNLSLANTAVTTLYLDPTDANALYAGTPDRGLLFSYTGGKDWQVALENQGAIAAISVDPRQHCTLYVAIGPALQKSVDCARNWERLLVVGSGRSNVKVVAVVADGVIPGRLYVGTSVGELHQSDNFGATWKFLRTFDVTITSLLINPNDHAILYVGTSGRGLWRSSDFGASWAEVTPREPGEEGVTTTRPRFLKGGRIYRDLTIDYTVRDGLVYASDAGLHRSDDGGATWQAINLPFSAESRVKFGQLLADRLNRDVLLFTLGSRLALTSDGGATWTWRDLPSKRPLVELQQPAQTAYLFTAFGPGPQR